MESGGVAGCKEALQGKMGVKEEYECIRHGGELQSSVGSKRLFPGARN